MNQMFWIFTSINVELCLCYSSAIGAGYFLWFIDHILITENKDT